MSIAIIGKEFILVNEELAIYISFLIVLTILVSNFGATIANQFAEQKNNIAQSYSFGSSEKVKYFVKSITNNVKTINYIESLVSFETLIVYKLLKLKEEAINAIIAAEYKLV